MSRFANLDAKERLVLGPCECPGTPHDEDWIEFRTEIGAELFEQMGRAMNDGRRVEAVGALIAGWNLLDNDGTEAAVDADHVNRLYADSFDVLNGWVETHVKSRASVPNRSAARSPITSVASGSRRTRRAKKAA